MYTQLKTPDLRYLNSEYGGIKRFNTASPGLSKQPNCEKHCTRVSFYTPDLRKVEVLWVVETFSIE